VTLRMVKIPSRSPLFRFPIRKMRQSARAMSLANRPLHHPKKKHLRPFTREEQPWAIRQHEFDLLVRARAPVRRVLDIDGATKGPYCVFLTLT
jgi:hypothetical protein